MSRVLHAIGAAPSVTVRAPGKVNLSLRVGPRGDDGFHPLVTVFQAVSLSEEVSVTEGAPGSGITLSVSGDGALAVPRDETNLAWRAALAIHERAHGCGHRQPGSGHGGPGPGGARDHVAREQRRGPLSVVTDPVPSASQGLPDVAIHLRKGVPVAGGMAGGSADAAATLVACNALLGAGLDDEALHELAAGLGSDVPFSLLGGTAVGTGRGDLLSPVMARGTYHWAFATFLRGLPTPEVFRRFDEMNPSGPAGGWVPSLADEDAPLLAALRTADAPALGEALRNDLQPAVLALRPDLSRTLDIARDAGALGAIVSGAGPTVAALASSPNAAERIAAKWRLHDAADRTLVASAPAPGARIL